MQTRDANEFDAAQVDDQRADGWDELAGVAADVIDIRCVDLAGDGDHGEAMIAARCQPRVAAVDNLSVGGFADE